MLYRALKKYEALKPLYRKQSILVDSLQADRRDLKQTLVYRDSALRKSEQQLNLTAELRQDAQTKGDKWRARAKSRWWLNVGLGALALGLGVLHVR